MNTASAPQPPATRRSLQRTPEASEETVPALRSRGRGQGNTVARATAISSAAAAASRPNTRSRKRRSTEVQAEQSPPTQSARKRSRSKPVSLKKPPPGSQSADGDKKPAATESCCICMGDVEPDDLAGINGCEHRFCFGCIEKWAERENSCPLCKNRFTKIDRISKKRRKGIKNTKKVKQRDQRSDLLPGAALEGLLGRLIEESRSRVPGRGGDLTDLLSSANIASRHGNAPTLARLIFSGVGVGVGSFDLNPIGGSTATLRARARGSNTRDEESSDEELSPLSTFFRAFHGHGRMVVQPTMTVTTHVTSRSYASNVNDRTAGNGAENPLEIDDDSDDDTVEVVDVRNTL